MKAKWLKRAGAIIMSLAVIAGGGAVILPQTAQPGIAVKAASVSDYVKTKRTATYKFSKYNDVVVRQPVINLSSADAQSTNKKIAEDFEMVFNVLDRQRSKDYPESFRGANYKCYLTGDILSLVINIDETNNYSVCHYVYNFNVKTGKRIYRNDIKAALGVTDADIKPLLSDYISYACDHRSFDGTHISAGDRSMTMTDSNINNSILYITGKNKLGFIYYIYNIAGPQYHTYPGEVTVQPSLLLNKTSMSLGKNETFKLTANQSVKWRTSAPKIVTVDQSGNVKAVGTGTAWVTARNNSGKETSCKITVKKAPNWVGISQSSLTMGVGESLTLSASVARDAAAAKRTFRTSNSSIVKMTKTDWTGCFTAVKPGTAWVTVRLYNGLEKSCKITVKPAPAKVYVNKTVINLKVGQQGVLGSYVNSGAASAQRKYRCNNSGIIRMTRTDWQGEFKALKAGVSWVTVRTYNGKEASCKVVVTDPNAFDISKYTGEFRTHQRGASQYANEGSRLTITKQSDGKYKIFSELIYGGGRRISQMWYTTEINSGTITFNAKESWLCTLKYTLTFKNGKIYFSQKMVSHPSSGIFFPPDETNLVFSK